MSSIENDIYALAADLGFADCGICDAIPSDYSDELRAWLEAGKHGEMAWLADHVDKRADPTQLLPGARSIICVADQLPAPPDDPPSDQPRGRIARYAQVSDYHKVMKKRLFTLTDALREKHPDQQFKVCVDTAPLLEREHAQRAGLGWTGKHTLTLNQKLGSHIMLGQIVTTLPLSANTPATDHCGTCTRCIDACPTDAITPRSVDATRCISYLTIEHRTAIDPQFISPIGDWLYGCDICQDVCPYVAKAPAPPDPPPGYEKHRASLPILEVLEWSEDDRRAAFTRSAMKRAKLDMIKRNALIVAINYLKTHEDVALRNRIRCIADDTGEAPLVRDTAKYLVAGAD